MLIELRSRRVSIFTFLVDSSKWRFGFRAINKIFSPFGFVFKPFKISRKLFVFDSLISKLSTTVIILAEFCSAVAIANRFSFLDIVITQLRGFWTKQNTSTRPQ